MQTANALRATTPILLSDEAFVGQQDGIPLRLFTLRNAQGAVAQLTNFGARLVSLWLPDREGTWADVVLGYPTLAEYERKRNHYGATVGRFANRIGGAQYTLDGHTYSLEANEGANCLHGGRNGFKVQAWHATSLGSQQVRMEHTSPASHAGFPGHLKATVLYTLTDDNEIRIEYEATTDAPTPVNFTHHSYFNLGGAGSGSILNHRLWMDAEHFLATDANNVPTGDYTAVADTPMDFTREKPISEGIDNSYAPLRGSFDHNYVLKGSGERKVAHVYEPQSGRTMEVHTTQPGMQFFTTIRLDDPAGKYGAHFQDWGSFCLETQHFPNSPNVAHFPNTILRPGETYRETCRYRFGLQD